MLIPIQQLIEQYGVSLRGVLHLGAHQAEEAGDYERAGAKQVVWIEGNPELMPVLNEELKLFSNQRAYNVLISDKDGQDVAFKVTNNFQSSSILELGTHKTHHPGIEVHHTLNLKTHRLDSFFNENVVDTSECNFLNIDLQGAELLALKGLGNRLNSIDYIYTEVNVGSVYVGCATMIELDRFLHERGFIRIATKLTKWQWGDALYVRKKTTSFARMGNILSAGYFQITHALRSFLLPLIRFPRRVFGKLKRMIIPAQISNVNPNDNGEQLMMISLAKDINGKLIIFDVGANVGSYSEMVLDVLSKINVSEYELHLFEPQKSCFETLLKKFGNHQNIRINPFALSDAQGEALINADFSGSSSASLYDRKEVSLNEKETVRLERLDDYMNKKGLSSVDLLKIDTEGNEKKVLVGAGNFLKPSLIKNIQFEYGGTYLDAGITLAEVVQMLMSREYFVGKLTAESIEYKEHLGDFEENYKYSNYIAASKKTSL